MVFTDAGAKRFPELAKLLGDVSVDTFISGYWEREPLHVAHGETSDLANLTSLAEIDAILTTRPHRHPGILLANAASPVSPDDYTEGTDRIDPVRLVRRFAAGSTIVLNHLDDGSPRVRELCARLETELGIEVQANTYLSPPGAQGFAVHYDSHDVIIVQCAGTKLWKLYNTPMLPMRGERFERESTPVGELSRTLTVRPGDVLYVPRGLMHGAVAESAGYSLHVTLGFHAVRWSEALIEALAAQALTDVELRQGLPLGALVDPPDPRDDTALREGLRVRVQRLVDTLRWEALRPRLARRYIDSRRDRVQGLLGDSVAEITPETLLAVRDGVHVSTRVDGEELVLVVNGRATRWPARAAQVIEDVLVRQRFALGDLDATLDDRGRVTLARRLIVEGLLRIAG